MLQLATISRPLSRCSPLWPLCFRSFARVAPVIDALDSDDMMREAIAWSDSFKQSRPTDLSKQDYELSYARSGGKGGQNVNKVETKAVLRFPVASTPWLPNYVKGRLRKHTYYASSSDSLVMSSSNERRREANVQDVIRKLHATIAEVASTDLHEPKSEAELKKEAAQQDRANERRLEEKKKRSRAQKDKMRDRGD